jgi:HKD family nuclease
MPVRVTLRTSKKFSPYRILLRKLIELPDGDSLVLCSGYIQQTSPMSSRGYKILGDELLPSIYKGCAKGSVKTIAGKFEYRSWLEYYQNFVDGLRKAGVNVNPYCAPKKNWHAKIAIRLKQDKPIAALIGSSNLTGPAFGINRAHWNFEGDVLMWGDTAYNSYFKQQLDNEAPIGDMTLILDPETHQPSEEEQLNLIYREVMSSGIEPLGGFEA